MSYLDEVSCFSDETIAALRRFIEDKRLVSGTEAEFVNPILREDIFDLLSKECTVLYYPLENEENDGFHVYMPVNDEKQHFVYINTAKHIEKQIYAAAHELGHIWTENGRALGIIPSCAKEEDALMNRFAAELLMPSAVFGVVATKKLAEYQVEEGKIYEDDFFRVAAYLMDEYYVPFQAVVRRMAEVNILDAATCEYIINTLYKSKDGSGEKLLRDCINEGGYTKLLTEPSKKKSMTGFYELLNQAEQLGLFGPEKVARLREMLNLPKVSGSENTIEIR